MVYHRVIPVDSHAHLSASTPPQTRYRPNQVLRLAHPSPPDPPKAHLLHPPSPAHINHSGMSIGAPRLETAAFEFLSEGWEVKVECSAERMLPFALDPLTYFS